MLCLSWEIVIIVIVVIMVISSGRSNKSVRLYAGVRPYQCDECSKAFTQRCSLESHCRKVHGRDFQFAHKQRRDKVYVCEECGHTTGRPELHYSHLKQQHPSSPALLRAHDKRYFKFAVPPPTSDESLSLPRWSASSSATLVSATDVSSVQL